MSAPTKQYAVRSGALVEVEPDEVDFELPSATRTLGTHINLIPGTANVNAPRLFYGARFYNQAEPVSEPEAPLVQALDPEDPEGRSFDEILGRHGGAIRADRPARVSRVADDYLELDDGQETRRVDLYRNFPFNRYTAIDQTALVKAGDMVQAGQVIARSNYTDANGTLALGKNARVAIVPYKGWGLDDSVVISQSWAKRLAGENTLTFEQRKDRGVRLGLEHFRSIFPTRYTKDQLERLDEDGVVRPGTVLNAGDPMILATRPKAISSSSASLGALSRVTRELRNDGSQIWDSDVPVVVTDVAKTSKGVKVLVKGQFPTDVGDKVVFRTGAKGTISLVVPDEKMPRTEDGRPLDVLVNPLSLPSRGNNELIYELALGKVARKLGKSIKVPGFMPAGTSKLDYVRAQLAEAGLTDKERVFDPESHQFLDNPVMVGDAYMLKLHHTAKKKLKSRATGAYDQDEQPSKGGESGAKRISGLETHGLVSSGATGFLREGITVRGQRNDEFWRAIREGRRPMPPGEPFVWKKYRALLVGSGIKPKEVSKGRFRLQPMTDKDLEEERPVEVRNGNTVDLNSLEPVRGGLFDSSLMGANAWGRIALDEPMPNPAYEDSIRHLLGLTKSEMREVLAGRRELE